MMINLKKQKDLVHKDASKMPIKQIRSRFFLLLAIAVILISVLFWLTLAVLKVNNIEPFGELASLSSYHALFSLNMQKT